MPTSHIPGPVYLDHAATTPIDPEVAATIMRLMVEDYGNAGSRTHAAGLAAAREVASARERLASALHCEPEDVVFTSGATEADNLAVLGLERHGTSTARRHVVTTAIEHKAVLEPVARLVERGFEATFVPPDAQGHVDAAAVAAAVRPDTLLVSVMHANNETGAIQPIEEIADLLSAEDGPFLHVDASQTLGRVTSALRNGRIDLVSLSSHKTFGPKGVGALVARRRNGRRPPLEPLMVGGGQERGLRPGTLPVPLVAGFGLAVEIAEAHRIRRSAACLAIRGGAIEAFAPLRPHIHGRSGLTLPNILGIAFPGIDSEAAIVALKDLALVSNGSACTSSRYRESHVVSAMGLAAAVSAGTLRISWSHRDTAVPWRAIADRLRDLVF